VIHPLTEAWGDVVEREGGDQLATLDGALLAARLRERGALWLRGFDASGARFGAFTDRFSRRTLPALHAGLNRARVDGDDRTMTVDLGAGLVGWHLEMGYSPARPDLLWFWCATPAAEGGETILTDGAALLRAMDPKLEAQFRARPIRYRFARAQAPLWSLFAGEPVDRAQALARLAAVPGVRVAPRDDGALDVEYVTSAIQRTRWGGEAFANSLVIFGADVVGFADGAPIEREVRLELAALAEACAVEIRWRAGDLLVVDNSRVMHGRLPFRDPARRIHVRMSDASF
jgi:alpha-ketoglutarate-dependent taurine dioxygenase